MSIADTNNDVEIPSEKDEAYYTHLMNDPVNHTPSEVGDPVSKDNPYPSNELGNPMDVFRDLCKEDPDGDGDEEKDESPEEERHEEEDRGPAGYGATSGATPYSSPDIDFIRERGQPDSESPGWDDTSQPVRRPAIKPINEPGPDPHFPLTAINIRRKQFAGKLQIQQVEEAVHQWATDGTIFRPVGKTIAHLPAGPYMCREGWSGPFLEAHTTEYDDIAVLEDGPNKKLIDAMVKFWARKEKYAEHKMIYKRAALLYGPQGGGKTMSLHLLSRILVDEYGGIILYCNGGPQLLSVLASAVRATEPDRPIISFMEDIDDLCSYRSDERMLLSMLDGENQISNIVYICTTNYPERLPARLINRPSRIDQLIKVGMPSARDRQTYLVQKSNGKLNGEELAKWVKDTNGMSIAHLRELIAAVFCLDDEYEEVLARLKGMKERPTSHGGMDGFS